MSVKSRYLVFAKSLVILPFGLQYVILETVVIILGKNTCSFGGACSSFARKNNCTPRASKRYPKVLSLELIACFRIKELKWSA